MKKINCKHGLDGKQEIQARRLRQEIEDGNYIVFKDRLVSLYNEYRKNACKSFYDYIKENDIVLYSAFERVGGISDIYDCLGNYGII